MPHITNRLLAETDYLPPSVNDLLEYDAQLQYESPYIEFEWANTEIKTNLLAWVKVGLIAEKMRYLKLYRSQFAKWKDYCRAIIQKLPWQVNQLIEAARVVLELALAGFTILPTCEAQASCLIRYFNHTQLNLAQNLLVEKWQQVLDSLPPHQITKNSIDEILGHPMMAKKARITINPQTRERLDRELVDRELPTTQDALINELLDDRASAQDPLFGFPPQIKKQVQKIAKRENISIEEVIAK
jgi:hypothetical protein